MSEEFDPTTHPHRRYNPLLDEHVLVSPHRAKRPWLGQTEAPPPTELLEYDPACFLCPGNKRMGGQLNDNFETTMTFENDFAAVLPPPSPAPPVAPHPMLTTEPVSGVCDVVIFHPRHDVTLAMMSPKDIENIVDEWTRLYWKRGTQEKINYVQIFENKGAMMGCSNPHPHSQAWSSSAIPTLPAKELAALEKYASATQAPSDAPRGPDDRPCMLCEYAHVEAALADRLVVKNEHWIAVVPWWATWPFEVLLLPYKRHISSLAHLTPSERVSFAEILSSITSRYDNLFRCSFAYSMGIHQSPVPGGSPEAGPAPTDVAHLHLHFNPPLLRSSTVRKFLVGYELMAEAQRDLTPEQAAKRLRDCSEVHYLHEPAVKEEIVQVEDRKVVRVNEVKKVEPPAVSTAPAVAAEKNPKELEKKAGKGKEGKDHKRRSSWFSRLTR